MERERAAIRIALVALQKIAGKGAPDRTPHEIDVLDTTTEALASIYGTESELVHEVATELRTERRAAYERDAESASAR